MTSPRDADTAVDHQSNAPVEASAAAPAVTPLGAALAGDELVERAGDYVLLGEMARGGFGVVYRAIHAQSGAPAAVKILHPELCASPSTVLRFEREVLAIQRLAHPNVVEVKERGRLADGRPYFAMELLTGSSLDEIMSRRGRVSVEEALSILEPLASAIDAAHAQNVIHRDIKASNVFICSEPAKRRVVLLDFGVAKLLDTQGPSLTTSRQVVGTPVYMAPEQWLGGSVDGRVDVFALGVLTYMMLTGYAPFDSTSMMSVGFVYNRPRPPSQRSHVPPAIDEPVLSALAKRPEERPRTAGDFVASLRACATLARAASGLPSGATERRGTAVYVEVRAQGSLLEEPDEALIMDLESILPLASAVLSESGLSVAVETGNNLLMVVENPIEIPAVSSLRRQVVASVATASRRVAERPMADPRISVGFVVAGGPLVISEDGALLGGGLLDPVSWVPSSIADGVLVSEEIARDLRLDGELFAGADGFLAVGAGPKVHE